MFPTAYPLTPFHKSDLHKTQGIPCKYKSDCIIIISYFSLFKDLQYVLIATGIKSKFFVLVSKALQCVAPAYYFDFNLNL